MKTKRNNHNTGPKPKYSAKQKRKALQMRIEGKHWSEIVRATGVSKNTLLYWTYCKLRLQEEIPSYEPEDIEYLKKYPGAALRECYRWGWFVG